MTKNLSEYDIFLTRIENLEKTIKELKEHKHISYGDGTTSTPLLEY